ncbi:MAG: DUF6475 domain-containing protein [Smithella sp.]
MKDLYWKVLEPFTDEECEAAFKEIIYENKFFPKPADFREVLVGKKTNRATLAWLEVLGSVARIGNYQSVKFDDPVIHSVINAMGGWPQLCMMEKNEEKWKQKEFERLYEVISSRKGNHPEYLIGTHEQENFKTGHEIEKEVVQIGFNNKTKLLQ